jgi:HPt (histidine-containing phosphotransfer) domain-containing protein
VGADPGALSMDDSSDRTRSNRGILAGQLERLGPAFRQRLARDREQFVTLLNAVGGADAGAPAALRELEVFAHKLHGTAAMFGHETLGAAAGELEAAAHAALAEGTPPADAAGRLRALYSTLEREIDAAIAEGPESRPG